MLLSALLHIFAGLKRTRDQELSSGLMSCQLRVRHIFAGLKRTRDQKLSSGLSYPSLQVEDKRACWLRSGFQHDSYLQ